MSIKNSEIYVGFKSVEKKVIYQTFCLTVIENFQLSYLRGEIQMIPESAYKSLASKNWEILWKNKL